MPDPNASRYCRRRAEEELALARQAGDAHARRAHYERAGHYLDHSGTGDRPVTLERMR